MWWASAGPLTCSPVLDPFPFFSLLLPTENSRDVYYSTGKVDTFVLFLIDFSFPVWYNLGSSFVLYNLLQ